MKLTFIWGDEMIFRVDPPILVDSDDNRRTFYLGGDIFRTDQITLNENDGIIFMLNNTNIEHDEKWDLSFYIDMLITNFSQILISIIVLKIGGCCILKIFI